MLPCAPKDRASISPRGGSLLITGILAASLLIIYSEEGTE